jgi:diguanylate cyclase (GGDEF)-like protein
MPPERAATGPDRQIEGANRGVQSRPDELRLLARPFWATLLIGAVSLLIFVTVLTLALDRVSVRSSEKIVAAVMADRSDKLKTLALEYGYWDAAVEKLVEQMNMRWVEDNLLDYMNAELGIENLHVLDGSDREKLNVVEDKLATVDIVSRYADTATPLIDTARSTSPDSPPVPATGFIGGVTNLHLAAAVRMTTYDEVDIGTDHVLLLAQRFDPDKLSEIGARYQLRNLRVSEKSPQSWEASIPVETMDGLRLGYFVWDPHLPSFRILPFLIGGVLLVYAGMLIATRFFFRRASALVNTLEEARRRADTAKELLVDQVRRDPLTGLGNRRYFDEAIAALATSPLEDRDFALLCLDLDDFKEVNDTQGHAAGDKVLQHVADSLRSLVRANDNIFRIGGDEFVILFRSVPKERVITVGRAIIDHLSEPVNLNGLQCRFSASVGISFSLDPSDLLLQADVALYSAKRGGKGQVSVYSPEMAASETGPLRWA